MSIRAVATAGAAARTRARARARRQQQQLTAVQKMMVQGVLVVTVILLTLIQLQGFLFVQGLQVPLSSPSPSLSFYSNSHSNYNAHSLSMYSLNAMSTEVEAETIIGTIGSIGSMGTIGSIKRRSTTRKFIVGTTMATTLSRNTSQRNIAFINKQPLTMMYMSSRSSSSSSTSNIPRSSHKKTNNNNKNNNANTRRKGRNTIQVTNSNERRADSKKKRNNSNSNVGNNNNNSNYNARGNRSQQINMSNSNKASLTKKKKKNKNKLKQRKRNNSNGNTNKPKSKSIHKLKLELTNEELSQMTIGQAIQQSNSIQQLLGIASKDNLPLVVAASSSLSSRRGVQTKALDSSMASSNENHHDHDHNTDNENENENNNNNKNDKDKQRKKLVFWIPSDDDLPPHILHQSIHHEKRFRSSCALLMKLSDLIGRENTVNTSGNVNTHPNANTMSVEVVGGREGGTNKSSKSKSNVIYEHLPDLWSTNDHFKRIVLAATLPFDPSATNSINSRHNSHDSHSGTTVSTTETMPTTALKDDSNNNNNRRIGSNAKNTRSGIPIEKECQFVTTALVALYSIAGYTLPQSLPQQQQSSSATTTAMPMTNDNVNVNVNVNEDILTSTRTLIDRAESLAVHHLTLNQAIEARWAIRGLCRRIPTLISLPSSSSSLQHSNLNSSRSATGAVDGSAKGSNITILLPIIPNLNQRVQQLPFDIIPSCIDWSRVRREYKHENNNNKMNMNIVHQQNSEQTDKGYDYYHDLIDVDNVDDDNDDIIQTLLDEIPFQFDTITTRSGSSIIERRSTAWVAERGIGSLAYSGKLMRPDPIPSFVQYTMRQVEDSIRLHDEQQQKQQQHKNDYNRDGHYNYDYSQQLKFCLEENGRYFDCALTNHYPELDAACKFHTDPEHGTFWERLTCVVSAGNRDVRKFAFRPIPQLNDWHQWDDGGNGGNVRDRDKKERDSGSIEPVVMPLFPGDCVKMWGECNDVFHHAVYGADQANVEHGNEKRNGCDGRVSLVFKKAIDRGSGRKGHGQKGEGRRSRRIMQ